jgi:hypothetical protein
MWAELRLEGVLWWVGAAVLLLSCGCVLSQTARVLRVWVGRWAVGRWEDDDSVVPPSQPAPGFFLAAEE